MPEGDNGQQAPQGGDQGQQNGASQAQAGQQAAQTPPWEREGQQFDPERAWSLIQTLRGERDGLRTERDQLNMQVTEFQQRSMSDQERAIAEAETRARQSALTEFGPQMARVHFDALAARRNPTFDTASALEFVDLNRFVKDGQVDAQALSAAVERLVPEPQQPAPSFDGGARKGAGAPTDMNAFIRNQAGRG